MDRDPRAVRELRKLVYAHVAPTGRQEPDGRPGGSLSIAPNVDVAADAGTGAGRDWPLPLPGEHAEKIKAAVAAIAVSMITPAQEHLA